MLLIRTINKVLLRDFKGIRWLIAIFQIIYMPISNVCFMYLEHNTNKNKKKYGLNQKIKRE